MGGSLKYKSIVQFLEGVASVNEPLTRGERLVLWTMAHHADYRTGITRPGNAKMMRAAANDKGKLCTRQGLNKITKSLTTRRGLIELKSEASNLGGRGLANVWRIRIEDPRFPEPETRNSTVAGIDTETRNSTVAGLESETRNCADGNPQLAEPKPATGGSKTRNCTVAPDLNFQPSIQPSFQPPPQAKNERLVGGWDGFVSSLPEEMQGAVARKDQRHFVEKQIKEYGEELLRYAIIRWLKLRAEGGRPIQGRADKWGAWQEEGGVHIAAMLKAHEGNNIRHVEAAAIPEDPEWQAILERVATGGDMTPEECEKYGV